MRSLSDLPTNERTGYFGYCYYNLLLSKLSNDHSAQLEDKSQIQIHIICLNPDLINP